MSPRYLPLLALFLAPLAARADANPDFESDAKPILARQPGLIEYIHSHFEVKETGVARIPGRADMPPQPPFIFNARPKGHSGPFYLALLIQPGPPGRIMKVADVRKLPPGSIPPDETAAVPPASAAPAASNPPPEAPQTPSSHRIGSSSPASAPAGGITSDTPSGAVRD